MISIRKNPLRRLRSLLAHVPLLVAVASPGQAQEAQNLWTVHTVESKILGEVRTVRVALPSSYDRPHAVGRRYPVALLFDGSQSTMLTTVAVTRELASAETPAIPELIVIGIESNAKRYHNFTPPPREGPARTDASAGGGPDFARFLKEELIPFLGARYRIQPFTMAIGHSQSGLYAAWLFANAEWVKGAIAASPSLVWNAGTVVQQIADDLKSRKAKGRLYFAAGIPELSLDSAAIRLAAALRRQTISTAYYHDRLPEDSHYTSSLTALVNGLRFVFRPVQLTNVGHPDRAEAPATAAAMLKYYRDARDRYVAGARELGLEERMPSTFAGALAMWLASSQRADAARQICQELVVSDSTDWVGYECLGFSLAALGDRKAAAEAASKAIRIVEPINDERILARLRRLLARVQDD